MNPFLFFCLCQSPNLAQVLQELILTLSRNGQKIPILAYIFASLLASLLLPFSHTWPLSWAMLTPYGHENLNYSQNPVQKLQN